MRYIKDWKLFESNKYDLLIGNIEDLSLELTDLGMKVKVWSEIDTKTDLKVPNSYRESIQVNIKEFPDGLLDIKEFIRRASYMLEGFHVKCHGLDSVGTVYRFEHNNIKDYDRVITDRGEFRDVDFFEIYIMFYKPEDVYHVVKYNKNKSGWNLVDVNISKEEALLLVTTGDKLLPNYDFMMISDREYWKALGDLRYFRSLKG